MKKRLPPAGFLTYGLALTAAALVAWLASPPIGLALACLAALTWLAWLCDVRWRETRSGGWRFLPNLLSAAAHRGGVEVSAECLAWDTQLFSQAPVTLRAGMPLQANSSSLLLAAAASLTMGQLPGRQQEALLQALQPIGMHPGRAAQLWPSAGLCRPFGQNAVLVKDGRRQRFFLCASAPDLTPDHLFLDREQPVDPEKWQEIARDASALAGDFTRSLYYYTGLWEQDAPVSLAYLGAVRFEESFAPDTQQALAKLQSAGIPLTEDDDALLIAALPQEGRRRQMICEDAPTASFGDALVQLRAQWQHRNTVMPLFFVLTAYLCLCGAAFMILFGMREIMPFLILPAAATVVFAGLRGWQLRSFRSPLAVMLCLIPLALVSMLLYAPRTLLSFQDAAAIVFAALTVGASGLQLALVCRQKGRRWPYLLAQLVLCCISVAYAAMTAAPLPAAFGAVLGALLQLPLWALPMD